MRSRSIPDLIDGVHCGIHRSIEPDRIFRARDAQIDRTRDANRIDPKLGKLSCSCK